jgi:enoyl-[acyl-carrier protein] reductase/trans-2-enoyl-CoA reductase (NAD+)
MLSEKDALTKSINCDEIGRIRMDDWELQSNIQSSIEELWKVVDSENISSIGDLEGYRNEFLKLFGFGHSNIDYSLDVKIDVNIPSIYNSDSQG